MTSFNKLFPRRFAPALIAAIFTAIWWSLTIFAPIATADPAGVVHALSRLATFAGLFGSANS